MKLNDYKRVMGRLTVSDSFREKIIVNATVGRPPRATADRSVRARFVRVMSVAATLAVIAAVATAFVLIVRFVGPEGPAVPGPGVSVEDTDNTIGGTGYGDDLLPDTQDPDDLKDIYDYILDRFIPLDFFCAGPEGLEFYYVGYNGNFISCGLKNHSGSTIYIATSKLYERVDGEWVEVNDTGVAFEALDKELIDDLEYTVDLKVNEYRTKLTTGQYMVKTTFYSSDSLTADDFCGEIHVIFNWNEDGSITKRDNFEVLLISTEGGIGDVDVMSYEDGWLNIVWKNYSENEMSYDPIFTLERLENGKWSEDLVDIDFDAVILSCPANMYSVDGIPIGACYADSTAAEGVDTLEAGVYRVQKNYRIREQNYTLTIEFEIK